MTQQPLFASKAPRVSGEDVARLIAFLDGLGWVTAAHLVGTHDWNDAHGRSWTDRDLRAIAAASQGRIISGQRGYARTDQASVEDVNHAAAWLQHQGETMIRRAHEIRQAMHCRTTAA